MAVPSESQVRVAPDPPRGEESPRSSGAAVAGSRSRWVRWVPSSRPDRWKLALFAFSLLLLVVSTWLALRQPAPPEFASVPASFSPRWWVTPLERNAVLRPPTTAENFFSVNFANSQSGWAVGPRGTILHSEDGGQTWNKQTSGVGEELHFVKFANSRDGWAVGAGGAILHTADGGRTWNKQTSGVGKDLYCVTFATAQNGWVVGDRGTILRTEDGGRTWNKQTSGVDANLYSVSFANSQSGWAVGSDGTILHSEDGGQTWNKQTSGLGTALLSVSFANTRRGWVIGWRSTILRTEDGGKQWRWSAYRRWPAPWFYLAVLVCFPGLIVGSLPSRPKPVEAIEDLANADKPIDALGDDSLGYAPLVERLRLFIQNRKTVPPLVLAIQGSWGMGKSSVMRMLESELKRKGTAVTVWFNAWHHQKEDQLLACLLMAVQKQAVPPWFSPSGIVFRFSLLRVRLFSSRDRALLTLLALFAAVSFSYWRHHAPILNMPKVLYPFVSVLVWLLLQPLIAFKSDPDKLMERGSRSFLGTMRDLLVLPSLIGKSDVRQEFAANLGDVAEALMRQRLVIFLDDLDRCKPEQVVQILEAINFLSSIAPCFIIVGADYQKVEALAAKEFEPIAVQEFENKRVQNAGTMPLDRPDNVEIRVRYARSYLKKIVNLRLNLSPMDLSHASEFLSRKPRPAGDLRAVWQSLTMFAVLGVVVCVPIEIYFYKANTTASQTQVPNPAEREAPLYIKLV